MLRTKRETPAGGQIVIIALYALIAGLSGLMTVPPLDRDESRFIQATTQMLETGDFVRINFQDDERNKKPVGIHWLQAASVNAFADVEDRPLWAYRLPSLMAAILAAIFTYLAGCALFGTNAAFISALLIGAAPVVMGEASIAKTDASLLAAITGMQAALAWALTGPKAQWRPALLVWVALGAGLLLKGPVAVMVLLGTLGGLLAVMGVKQNWRPLLARVKPLYGLLILLLMVAPWVIAIGILTEGRFYAEALGVDMLGKVTNAQEAHGAPPGTHFVLFWLMFWPASLFVLAAARHVLPRWREAGILFCLAWLVPSWAVFEIASTKLPHYPMVLYPAIALLIGYALTTVQETEYRGFRLAGAGIYAAVGITAVVLLLALTRQYSSAGLVIWHYLAAGLICTVALLAALLVVFKRSRQAVFAAIFASALLGWGAFEGVLPTLDRLALTPRLAKMLDQNDAHPLKDNRPPVGLVGYHEPSAVFTLGTETRLLTPVEAAIWITAAPDRVVVVTDNEQNAFLSALPNHKTAIPVASIEGFNYSKNRNHRLTLYRLSAS